MTCVVNEAPTLCSSCRVSKQIMSESSVPIVPGYFGEDQSDERLREEAEKIGSDTLVGQSVMS